MALEWTFVAYVLYAEIAVFLLLCIPMPAAWRHAIIVKLTNSSIIQKIKPVVILVFCIVGFLFFVAVREEMTTHKEHHELKRTAHNNDFIANEIRMFRSQRNVYMTGFSLFLLLVLNRFYWLLVQVSDAEKAKANSDVSRSLAERQGHTTTQALIEADNLKKTVAKLEEELKKAKGSDELARLQENARTTLAENNKLREELRALRQSIESDKDK